MPPLNVTRGYLIAAAATVAALVLEMALEPAIFRIPYMLFVFAVAIATAYGGIGPGLVALIVSVVVGNVFFQPPTGVFSYDPASLLSTVFFIVIGMIVVWLVDRYRTVLAALRRDRHLRTLVIEASAALDRSLDFEQTLRSIAWLAVPRVADWCSVGLVHDGVHQRLTVAHRDPQKIAFFEDMMSRYPPPTSIGVQHVIATGRSELVSEVTPAFLSSIAVDQDHLRMLRELGICSYACVPMRRGGKVIGVLSVAMAESGRHYTKDDVAHLDLLSDRAAVAVERAQLFTESQVLRLRAEEASRAKDEFLAILGHELRNPLAPILLALQLMEEHKPPVLVRERTVIDRQIRQLGRLVDDLLDVTRIVRGRIELHEKPVEVAHVVTTAVETAESLIEERRHTLTMLVPDDLWVCGDETRLVQVVVNLLSNAAKYTERGGKIEIAGDREDDQIVLRVRDNGVGISPEMLPHVFEMFVQEHQNLDRRRGGLGLGLAIVRNLILLHHGEVSATSEGQGKGSEVVIRLPALDTAKPVHKPEPPETKGPPVLVVDDNRDALELLAQGLELRGIATARAADGPSALAVAANQHPHVALLDIGLPVMDGYELGRRLHQLDRTMQLVAVTGYGRPGDRERSQQEGFVAHMIKPVDLDKIHSIVRELEEATSPSSATP